MTILVKRDCFEELANHLKKPEIGVIVGPRQAGKTTLLKQLGDFLQEKGTPRENIYFFNLDVISDRETFKSQQEFILFLRSRLKKDSQLYIFVDEAQRIKNPGIFFKGIYDLGLPAKFILTGSSALEIKANIHEALTGRKRVFHLQPFNFNEFLRSKKSGLEKIIGRRLSETDKNRLLEILREYLVFGGYPKVALESNHEEKKKLLEELYSSYLEKDIVGFLRIKSPLVFSKLTGLLASQIGQLVNISEIGQMLGLDIKTLNTYLHYLEETFIVNLARPFYKNYRKEITKMPKVYFADLGLRNFALSRFKPYDGRDDQGSLLENFVFNELCGLGFHVNYWRTKSKAEVDFVIQTSEGQTVPLEAKAAALKTPYLSRSFRSFLAQYLPKKGYLVNLGLQKTVKADGCQVKYILPFDLPKLLLRDA
ncbi:ATPase [Candidatus Saganbacteria bacterium CG08_land_8_20_14_0_20_45_16]|uniref:ATPase n=1 Tax=Candidatus Saganbacteria bacterium CG08_land_8_20_14_0_20_45_16 TaxID=2014293 RepID=A0A2H0Y1M5_UNCSA|nr:MAG: ATPase [Candidatus Saganbacteria bacterium CG08_land_8_20_14_0_20_45_16]